MIKRREDNWRAQINSNLNEFGLLRPVCSRPTLDVRLRDRQTDRQTVVRQTSDSHHRLMLPTLGIIWDATHQRDRRTPTERQIDKQADSDVSKNRPYA